MRIILPIAAALAWSAAAIASPPASGTVPTSACRAGVLHAALLSPAQMCPRPLTTTIITMPHHRTLRT